MKREKHANELEISGGILYYARCFNSELARNDYEDVAESLKYWGRRVGWLVHQNEWHKVSGNKVTDLPFEMEMAGIMLLTRAWLTDIFCRKARDRQSPEMLDKLLALFDTSYYVSRDIIEEVVSHRAHRVFMRYVHDLVKYRQIAQLQRLGFLPKLSLPRRLWYRTFGIPDGMVFRRVERNKSARAT